jgi:ribosomal-protein-alanine N-acetyltransferase
MMRTLEPLTIAHAELIAGMHRICFAEPWDKAAMASLLAMPGAFGWLAAADGVPQGFVLARTAADEAEILTLVVLPPHRRRGLGAALIGAAAAEAKRRGAATLFLEVAANNQAARALYTAGGFSQSGTRPRYYGNSIDALLMTRDL